MMAEPTIQEMNEVIALFDGYEKYEDSDGVWFKKEGQITCMHTELKDFKYHSSLDWLKPVIDKIFTYALAYREQVLPIISMSIVVEIKAAHKAVYDFIIWYNQLNAPSPLKDTQ